MPRNGRRHQLVLYSFVLGRLWRSALWIGVFMLALAGGLAILPGSMPQVAFLWEADWILWTVAGAGGFAVLLAVFFLAIRKFAYVQPGTDALRLVTPFLRMNISYRRILQASTVEMQHLFPPNKYKGLQRKLLLKLGSGTAIVLEMRGWPMPRGVLKLFLSPFFFPDKSARLALLVPKWMNFSTEMESFRSRWIESQKRPAIRPRSALLSSLSKPKR
jgi:hypothetical protein